LGVVATINETKCFFVFMAEFIDRTGEKYVTNEGLEITIIECFNNRNCTVRFEDGTILSNRKTGDIKLGKVKNPNLKSVYGVGYLGIDYKKSTKIYQTWQGMLKRCYDKKYQVKFPTYICCSVDERWHNFQVFAEWFESNYRENFALDKDILVKGNKVYSPETCAFVPQEINSLFLKRKAKRGSLPIGVRAWKNKFIAHGVNIDGKRTTLGYFDTANESFQAYKIPREHHIKRVAEKWRGKMDERVYDAMINYEIEITD
jgi:hypothetical protein